MKYLARSPETRNAKHEHWNDEEGGTPENAVPPERSEGVRLKCRNAAF